ncbi:MAG TPA: bifunctional demethylmenaquinone methyltransferase/2-methoxy-6-polyprenyl-1,4-benzoquinol methylase UbiE [Chloroflexota bacterium]|nr:bifunctional demethylmenaquinone methyltransferase/2-methoxy-6-polyprenyl-1,4-benzoquinol methylase UbiE [Chloroflexota bacterium]
MQAELSGQQGAELTGAARADYVRQLFARIVPRYDLFNTLSTFGQDRRWRRLLVRLAALPSHGHALDVATGTGAVAFELATQRPTAQVVGTDFCEPMIAAARARAAAAAQDNLTFELGDVRDLPYPDRSFDCVTVSFGVRNFSDLPRSLAEMRRVLKPGGRFVCLELTHVRSPLIRLGFNVYFYKLAPWLGALLSGEYAAYSYLPHSLTHFPDAAALAVMLDEAGFQRVRYRLLNFGAIAIHMGIRAER